MSQINICDRCDERIKGMPFQVSYGTSNNKTGIELCKNCEIDFRAFLPAPKKHEAA